MEKMMDLARLWHRGALAGLIILLALGAGAVVVGLPLTIATGLLGADAEQAFNWLLALSPLWAPIWIGFAIKYGGDLFDRRKLWAAK